MCASKLLPIAYTTIHPYLHLSLPPSLTILPIITIIYPFLHPLLPCVVCPQDILPVTDTDTIINHYLHLSLLSSILSVMHPYHHPSILTIIHHYLHPPLPPSILTSIYPYHHLSLFSSFLSVLTFIHPTTIYSYLNPFLWPSIHTFIHSYLFHCYLHLCPYLHSSLSSSILTIYHNPSFIPSSILTIIHPYTKMNSSSFLYI